MPEYKNLTAAELRENEFCLLDETFLPIADCFLRKYKGSALLTFLSSGLGAVGANYYWDELPKESQEAIKRLTKTRIKSVVSDKRLFHWVTSPLMEAYLEVEVGFGPYEVKREEVEDNKTYKIQVSTPDATIAHTVHKGDYVFFFNKYNDVARGRVEQVLHDPYSANDKTHATLDVLFGYDIGEEKEILIPSVAAGDRGEVAFRSYMECECGDIECFENTQPCKHEGWIPLYKFCFKECKDFFITDYDPSKTKFSRKELYTYNAMRALSDKLDATFWDQAESTMIDDNGQELHNAGGLRWYAETFGRTVVIDSCCLADVMDVLHEVSMLRMQSASGETITNNEWIIFCGYKALKKIQGVVPVEKIDYVKDFDSLREEQEAYMTLASYTVVGFRTGGAKFIFVEDPYLTRTTPEMAYGVLIDAISFITLKQQSINANIFNGQDRHTVDYGGIFRDITRPTDLFPDSDCPVTIRIEMNLRLHILNPEHMVVLYLSDCGACDGALNEKASEWISRMDSESGYDAQPKGDPKNPWQII